VVRYPLPSRHRPAFQASCWSIPEHRKIESLGQILRIHWQILPHFFAALSGRCKGGLAACDRSEAGRDRSHRRPAKPRPSGVSAIRHLPPLLHVHPLRFEILNLLKGNRREQTLLSPERRTPNADSMAAPVPIPSPTDAF
jgi:hypothetical protein